MYRFTGFCLTASLIISMTASAGSSTAEDYVEAYLNHQPIEQFSRFANADSAYAFQQQVNQAFKARNYQPVGYKLAQPQKLQMFQSPETIYGQLYDFMQLKDGARISLEKFTRPLLGMELAVRMGKTVTPPFTREQLHDAISGVAPAIDLADVVFTHPREINWKQLIATGVGARYFILGPMQPLSAAPLDAQQTEARRNGELYSRGYSRNVADGSQLDELVFLANQLNRRGTQLREGDWVLIGAMNSVLPARAGAYQVDFGALGKLSFTLTE